MKIFMITRGSQGDVLPYLAIAEELTKRGHEIAINLPTAFEERVKEKGWKYYLQTEDDMRELLEEQLSDTDAIKWIGRVMNHQCQWLPDVIKDYDILISTITETAAPTVAEYCNIPFIRTVYAPLLPSKLIPPPLFPWPKPNPVITPNMLWFLSRTMGYFGLKKVINENRKKFGLKLMNKISDFKDYTSTYGHNALNFSSILSDVDPVWAENSWKVTGYCFNDEDYYDETTYQKMMDFVHAVPNKPIVFFTIGSCDYPRIQDFYKMLLQANNRLHYRLIVGAGWSKNANDFQSENDVFVLKGYVPHRKILPECSAIIHHGGCGTTHSAARFALPQLHLPLIIDQYHWAYQCFKRGIAPQWLNAKKINVDLLTERLRDTVENPIYKQNAIRIAEGINKEDGVKNFCDYIESFKQK